MNPSANAVSDARRALDKALAEALPLSRGRVRRAIERLQHELALVDERVPSLDLASLFVRGVEGDSSKDLRTAAEEK